MSLIERPLTRAHLLKAGAAGTLGLYLASPARGARLRIAGVTLNWLTWADHYLGNQLAAVAKQTGLRGRPTLFSDNPDALLKVKQTGSQFDIVSGDALWVPKYHRDGLTESFDINSIPAAKQLYSIARQLPFWKDGNLYMGYPFGWSTQQLYYNPAYVKVKPDSWQVLADKRYRGKIVLLNAPTDMVAMAGLATGAKNPYAMSPAQISRAKQFLKAVKPNILKLGVQQNDIDAALVDGSAWIVFSQLGTETVVKEAGGPVVKAAFPKEGTIGYIDSEQIVKASKHKDVFEQFIDAMEQANWIAQLFLKNGHPQFNEKAYKLLVNQGHKDRADRYFYNKPELALQTHLKGPGANSELYTQAFNEVFGA